LDGCTDESFLLKSQFDWVKWDSSKKSTGASPARNMLYKKAKGQILIGLDDDAHPLYADFIERTVAVFEKYPNVGVLAFEEIKGVFNSDAEALLKKQDGLEEYLCSEFVGCGFAIRKSVYEATNGFPVWIDIYGEESCISIEVLSKGYDILYTNKIAVNHRVNREERIKKGRNYYRFEKQLKNTTFYYLVYYPFPLFKIAKLFWHNFKKYACSDWKYFKTYFQTLFTIVLFLPRLIPYRNPIDPIILARIRQLPNPKF
jgi:GT2 family glycosyltransferase